MSGAADDCHGTGPSAEAHFAWALSRVAAGLHLVARRCWWLFQHLTVRVLGCFSGSWCFSFPFDFHGGFFLCSSYGRKQEGNGHRKCLNLIQHCTSTPFPYALETKDEFPEFLLQCLTDCRSLFRQSEGCESIVLRSDNASVFHSAQARPICREQGHQASLC